MMWPPSNLSLAIDMWDASRTVPDEVAAKLRRYAARTDAVFLRLDHDLTSPGKGFVLHANTTTLEPGRSRQGKTAERGSYTQTWATA